MESVDGLVQLQAGVIARQQLVVCGLADHDIKRLVRRRELAPLRRGILVNHTGAPTWIQHAWGAVLHAAQIENDGRADGACLCHASALRLLNGPGGRTPPERPIHVLVDARRTVRPAEGLHVHRSTEFELRVLRRYPPTVSYPDAALDVASSAPTRADALATLSRAVGDRHTTAARMLELSRRRPRVRDRAWLERVLADIDVGTCSVLEHGFLAEVVRPHRLPAPSLQTREETPIGVVYRDATYAGIIVELDGRMFHSSFDRRDADLDRDLIAATLGQRTVRLGWGQVFRSPCRTAAALGSLIKVEPRLCRRSECGVLATR